MPPKPCKIYTKIYKIYQINDETILSINRSKCLIVMGHGIEKDLRETIRKKP
jgi:hypothetical protein